MKLSRLSFLLILIGSALLLSDAEPPSPKPKPSVQDQRIGLTGDINKETQKDKDKGVPKTPLNPTPQAQQTTNPIDGHPDTHNKGNGANKRDESWWWQIYDWSAGITAQGFFNFVIAVATVFLAIFTCKLVRVTRDMHKATQSAADAAEHSATVSQRSADAAIKSAGLAELALRIERPYLPIEEIKLRGFDQQNQTSFIPDLPLISATIIFRNYGRGAARIEEIIGAMKVVDGPLPVRDYSGCTELKIDREVIGADQLLTTYETFSISESDRNLIREGKKQLVVYGRVKYTGFTGLQYIRGFYWEMEGSVLGILPFLEHRIIPGPKTHNYDEEIDTGPP